MNFTVKKTKPRYIIEDNLAFFSLKKKHKQFFFALFISHLFTNWDKLKSVFDRVSTRSRFLLYYK